ncbi:BZ3500_MvSof-1268-A1-R1_Chr2-2g04877 [Microbotryum saponariae]|uniref:Ataxin-10 homolog n=1 Tax=Microbotryum saponariae TaxID=289078 RepID=A0A2X0LMW5_9BASI|nr:BZ3500_MvSof-1268-A1-R1_Chr2-2g04877 [Microbotryum saponariae]SDA00383.1 BZ3501_MvSof-1269-A2-R1_Chr2-2g04551 [Microbotryum saponariae]
MAAPTAEHLAQQLARVSSLPEELIQVVKTARLALRDDIQLRSIYGQSSSFWTSFAQVWRNQAQLLARGDSTSELASTSRQAITSLAYLLLSICTNDQHNQRNAASKIEPHLRSVLLTASSLTNLENEQFTPMTRACCQALANLITGNEDLATQVLKARLVLEKDDKLISRLFASQDSQTLEALLIFLLNVIHGSQERSTLLATWGDGPKVLDRMLVLIDSFTSDEEQVDGADPSAVKGKEAVFSLGYAIGQQLIENGAWPQAYENQRAMSGFIISASQTTLLKFLDGYLSEHFQSTPSPPSPSILSLPSSLTQLLASFTQDLSTRDRSKDGRDANTLQGAVLAVTCLNSLGLHGTEGREAIAVGIGPTIALLAFANSLPTQTPQMPLPKISPIAEDTSTSPTQTWLDPPAIGQIKRECVRFLAIASSDHFKAQEEIREKGGLVMVLGMCQIDDSNPTLRELALFAIRNLLKGNERNQALVAGLEPRYVVGRNGELRDLPAALRPDGRHTQDF